MGVSIKENKSEVFTDIEELYKYYLLRYKNEENKNFRISLVKKIVELVKEELKNRALSNNEQLNLIDLLQESNRIIESLNQTDEWILTQYPNIEDYPPYHLHKKSQSTFGKV